MLYILCLIFIAFGIVGLLKHEKYKNDTDTVDMIKDWFKQNAKEGIEPQKLPKDIVKTGYLTWMQKDKIIVFKDGKYYLEKK